MRPLSLNTIGYLPSGPTASLFALLAQYHASIPHTVRYRISTSTSSAPSPTTGSSKSLTLLLSDKSTTYLIAAQLALSQFPGMLVPAALGWGVGMAWRMEFLPGLSAGSSWRVPAWMVGERENQRMLRGGRGGGSSRSGEYDDLRRRLEGEAAAAASGSASASASGSGTAQRQRVRMVD